MVDKTRNEARVGDLREGFIVAKLAPDITAVAVDATDQEIVRTTVATNVGGFVASFSWCWTT